MTAPRLTAKEKADRAPVATLYRNNAWDASRLKPTGAEAACAIVGPCLTGAHTTPEPEPVP